MKLWMVRDREHCFEERRRGRKSSRSRVYTINGGILRSCRGPWKEIQVLPGTHSVVWAGQGPF